MMVNGYVFGLILYLSMLHFGYACVSKDNECAENVDCCDTMQCIENICEECAVMGDSCGAETWEWVCCPTLTCFLGWCLPCSELSHSCGHNYPDCCSGLRCAGGQCVPCNKKYYSCGDGYLDCCSGLTCTEGMCL